jgi:DNA-binding NarL/FixJ family response regulator
MGLAAADAGAIARALSAFADDKPGLPYGELAALGRALVGGPVTIDFAAAQRIGMPVVVLRPAAADPHSALVSLSRREGEVAALIARGLSNKAIARELGLSLATVKDHVHSALNKAGLPCRAALAAAAVRAET